MGFQNWISSNSGKRKKGISVKELQAIFIDNITTKLLYEPIYCCKINDRGPDVRNDLERRGFDIIGVRDNQENLIGFAKTYEIFDNQINKYIQQINFDHIISDSTPIVELLNVLSNRPFCFVLQSNKIVGILTRADINKPIVRIYLFGLISLFEMHLNLWINDYYQDNSWKDELKIERFEDAVKIFEHRKGTNQDLTLLECLQFCDKRDILKNSKHFIKCFDFSKRSFERLLSAAEKVRNELVHSQSSIIANLDWERFVETITKIETFLHASERIVEEEVQKLNI